MTIKNKSIKSYNIRKQFSNLEEINNFIKFSGEKSISIDYDADKSISVFHEDYNDVDSIKKTLTMEIRVKKFEKDNKTPRSFKVYNHKTSTEEIISLEQIMSFYKSLGFVEYTKIYTLDEKLNKKTEKLQSNSQNII